MKQTGIRDLESYSRVVASLLQLHLQGNHPKRGRDVSQLLMELCGVLLRLDTDLL